jgi:hypothetical protein
MDSRTVQKRRDDNQIVDVREEDEWGRAGVLTGPGTFSRPSSLPVSPRHRHGPGQRRSRHLTKNTLRMKETNP